MLARATESCKAEEGVVAVMDDDEEDGLLTTPVLVMEHGLPGILYRAMYSTIRCSYTCRG